MALPQDAIVGAPSLLALPVLPALSVVIDRTSSDTTPTSSALPFYQNLQDPDRVIADAFSTRQSWFSPGLVAITAWGILGYATGTKLMG